MNVIGRISDKYIWWSVAQLIAGIAIFAFGYFTSIAFYYYLLLIIIMLYGLPSFLKRGRKPDERELHLLLKVHANAGVWTLMLLPAFHSRLGEEFFTTIWGIFLLLRGCFGLFYFLRN
jgi:hypothetical protein